MIGRVFTKLIKRVRPNYTPHPDVPLGVLIGWYVRKGFLPLLRGVVLRSRFGSAKFPTFIGRNVSLAYASRIHLESSVSIGTGSSINAFSDKGVHIASGCTIRENAWIQCSSSPVNPGVGLEIRSNTYIGPGAILGVGGPIVIGSDCQIGAGFTVVAENHQVGPGGASHSVVTRAGITIGNGCWIGHRVTIVDGVTLGEGCVVGAGAVVTKSFPARSTIVGVPGKLIAGATASTGGGGGAAKP
jgi:acetyltransferase-like isoleucine patch superfamily enzyme